VSVDLHAFISFCIAAGLHRHARACRGHPRLSRGASASKA
jgi:hypothetical protein